MQTVLKTTLAAALSLAAFSPALAEEQPIVVKSPAAMEQWQQDVTRSLDRRLRIVDALDPATSESGIVQLRFSLANDGKPENLEVVNSSTNRRTEKIAIRAVRGLTALDEAPVANVEGRTFQANVIFARDFEEHAQLKNRLVNLEAARMALSEQESDVVVLGG